MLAAGLQLLLLVAVSASSSTTFADKEILESTVYSTYIEFTFRYIYHPGSLFRARGKVIFPGDQTTSTLRVDGNRAPFPVVIFLGGAVIESNRYQWIGERLAADHGIVWVAVDMLVSLKGIELLMSMPGAVSDPLFRNSGLTALFKELKRVNRNHPLLKRSLDLDRVILGGHSWGGRVVLVDGANKGFFKNVVGAFVYAAHAEQLPGHEGFPRMLPLRSSVPLLLMAASGDKAMGLGVHSAFKTGNDGMRYMFERAISPHRQCYYVELNQFNHMSIIVPEDETLRHLGESTPTAQEKNKMLDEFYHLVSLFIQTYVFSDANAKTKFETHLIGKKSPYIKDVRTKGIRALEG